MSVSLAVPGLPSLSSGESRDLNLHSSLTFVYCVFPVNFPQLTLHPQRLLSLAEGSIYPDGFGHFGELLSVPGPLPGIQAIDVLLNLHLFFSC